MINITDARARQLWQSEMNRQEDVLEAVQIRELKPVLNRQYMNSAKALEQGITDINFAVDAERIRIRNLLSRHYRRIAAVFGDKVFKVIEESKKGLDVPEIKTPKEEFWGELNRWMETQAGRRIRHIQDKTKKNIAAVIQKGMNEGESHRTIARNIRKNGRITTPRRAIKIARTETHTASVKSVNSAVASTRIEMEREWVATRDDRTRTRGKHSQFDHRVADGERTTQDGKYTKTGEALDYPGDPSGSPGNIIQCRCCEIFHPVRATDKLKPYEPEAEPVYETPPIKDFIKYRDGMPKKFKPFSTPYTEKQYNKMDAKTFLSHDKKSGYALTKENDLISVFSLPNVHQGKFAVIDAIKRGAKTLDCYDGTLPKIYAKFGFEEYKRIPWNPKYAPIDWNYKKYGRPDVIAMKLKEKAKKEKKEEPKPNKGTKAFQDLQAEFARFIFGKI